MWPDRIKTSKNTISRRWARHCDKACVPYSSGSRLVISKTASDNVVLVVIDRVTRETGGTHMRQGRL